MNSRQPFRGIPISAIETNSGRAPLKILLVADDAAFSEELTRRLNDHLGVIHQVNGVGSLQAATEAINASPIDLVVLDICLPDCRGLDTYRRLQLVAPDMPTVILSADEFADLAVRAVRMGAQDFLLKSEIDDLKLRRSLMFAIERRRRLMAERQLAVGRVVQRTLLPEGSPSIDGYDVAATMLPAAETTGDYFDYFTFHHPDGEPLEGVLGVAVGDVCGHGLGAAIMMAEVRGCLHSLALRESDPGLILRCVHEIVANNRNNYFLTIFLAAVDTHRHAVTYASAGHPVWHFRADGHGTCLPALACPLGLPLEEPLIRTSSATIELAPGEGLLLPTDGIYEATRSTDEPIFGTQRMMEAVRENWREPAHGVVSGLIKSVLSFSRRSYAEDDLTAILIRRDAAVA